MRSPSTSTHKKSYYSGFTLIELLIVIGLLGVVATLGLFISFDFYKSYAFRSERNIIVSVLQKARSQSINNIDQVRHGVHFQSNPLKYVIFECPISTPACTSYTASSADQPVTASYSISVTNPAIQPSGFDVVFDQLSGSCVTSNCATSPLVITVSDAVKSYNITVNSVGRIDW